MGLILLKRVIFLSDSIFNGISHNFLSPSESCKPYSPIQ